MLGEILFTLSCYNKVVDRTFSKGLFVDESIVYLLRKWFVCKKGRDNWFFFRISKMTIGNKCYFLNS